MSTTVKVQIQQRIDTASNWASANPTPLSGEICWNSDDKKYKIGDGSTAWASLAYAPGSGGYTAGTGVSISASNVISASAVALTTVQTAANQTAMLALTTQEGDVVVRSDENKSYVRNSGTAGSMADFTLLATPTDAVLSVNGNTGAITAAQLAAAIEAASDSNTFTDADHTKLNGIAASANNYSISTDLLDEDNFATNSATKVASQQSIKAYVDTADALKANLSGATFTGDVTFDGETGGTDIVFDRSDNALEFADNAKAIFGSSNDTHLYHNGSHSYLSHRGDGDLILEPKEGENGVVLSADGSCKIYYDDTERLETTSWGISIVGRLRLQTSSTTDSVLQLTDIGVANYNFTFPDTTTIKLEVDTTSDKQLELKNAGSGSFDLKLATSSKIKLGASNDLTLYFDGSHSTIKNDTGSLYAASAAFLVQNAAKSESQIISSENGAVELFWDNSKHLETDADGVKTYGRLYSAGTFAYIESSSTSNSTLTLRKSASGADSIDYLQCRDNSNALIYKISGTGAVTANTVNANTFTSAGSVLDSKGDVRSIPQNTQGSAYTLVAADAGKHILASGNITVPDSIFTAGQAITIINNTGGNLTINKGTNMYNAADGTSANRTLATRGMATILFTAADTSYISGAGLS